MVCILASALDVKVESLLWPLILALLDFVAL